MTVGVVGGGEFGRGIAKAAARAGNAVALWSRKAEPVDAKGVRVGSDLSILDGAELLFLAVPSPYVATVAQQLEPQLDGRHLLVHVSRGLAAEPLRTLTTVLKEETPCRRLGALAGPLVAGALHEGAPSGAIVGSRFPEVADAVRRAIASPSLRIYETRDVLGVEIASALVGFLALAVGYAQQVGTGPAALAVFLTRGMAEAQRFTESLGGDPATLGGLAGYGDLLSVMAGDQRPEVAIGRALGAGESLENAAKRAGGHVEGLSIAAQLVTHAEEARIDAPITRMIAKVLREETKTEEVIAALMARRVGRE